MTVEIVISGRRTGKTEKAVEWVKEGNKTTWWPYSDRTIIVFDAKEKFRLRHDYQLTEGQVQTAQEFRNGNRGLRTAPKVWIDNLDIILSATLGIPRSDIEGLSMTGELA